VITAQLSEITQGIEDEGYFAHILDLDRLLIAA